MIDLQTIRAAIPNAFDGVDIAELGERTPGKVRDNFVLGDRRVLVASDRVSAFDRVLGLVPYKGQVLNQVAAWWFRQTKDIVANHVVDIPDPNVTIGRQAKPLPVEVIVRGHLSGVTSTSLWTMYSQGVERPYGLDLPAGMKKNDPLPEPVITPTTKAERGEHDGPLTCDEVVSLGLVEPTLWEEIQRVAHELFRRGQELAARAGLILVDTKYEFGLIDGTLTLIDEIHTPDSSRFWRKESYDATRGTDEEPEHLDKEYLRKWFAARGYRGDGTPPTMSEELTATLAQRYIWVYEQLTGETFSPGSFPVAERVRAAVLRYVG